MIVYIVTIAGEVIGVFDNLDAACAICNRLTMRGLYAVYSEYQINSEKPVRLRVGANESDPL